MSHRSLILFAGLFISPSLSLAETPQAGRWQAKTTIEINGLALPATENEECVTPAEAKDFKNVIAKELKEKGCELTKWSLKNKKLDAALKCKSEYLGGEGQLSGDVTSKSYDITGSAEGHFHGLPTSAKLKLTGRWLRACP